MCAPTACGGRSAPWKGRSHPRFPGRASKLAIPSIGSCWPSWSVGNCVVSPVYRSREGTVAVGRSGRRTGSPAQLRSARGLPPAPEQIERFLKDESPGAYEKLVDQLLASPHHGERMARHWIDLVHFAETHGHDQDQVRPNAWRYRDYLIESFNADTPYSRFIEEQIGQRELAEIYWNDPVRRITEAQGRLRSPYWTPPLPPPTHWCQLSGGTWVQIVVVDRRVRLFRTVREVVIVNLPERPPGPTR